MSNLVNFVVGTSAAYANVNHDANTLYFLTDTHQIMKGDYDYGSSVIVASSLPMIGVPSKVYIVNDKVYTYEKKSDRYEWSTLFDLSEKANLSGAVFTGQVTLANDPVENLDAATKHYVDSQVASKDAMTYRGTIGENVTIDHLPTSDIKSGDTYRVVTSGQYAGYECEIGDMLIALETKPSGSTDANWTVVQSNIDGAVIGPAESVDRNVATFSGETGKVVQDSGIKIGSSEFESQTSDSTLATEAGVESYVNSSLPAWGDI